MNINDEFFTDPNWRVFALNVVKATGAYPNRRYFNATKNQAPWSRSAVRTTRGQ